MDPSFSFFNTGWNRTDRIPTILLSGAGLTLCFPPFPFSVLAGCVLLPLLDRWRNESSARNAWMEAYFVFQIPFLTLFSWPLFHLMPSAALPSLTPIILLPLIMAAPFGIGCLIRRRAGMLAGLLTLLATFMIQEWLLHLGPFAFPSTLLGNALSEAMWFNQFADLTGVAGLTAWIMVFNLSLHATLHTPPSRRRTVLVVFLMVLAVGPAAYSFYMNSQHVPTQNELVALVVQPALPARAWAEPPDSSRMDHLIELTRKAAFSSEQEIDFIIWPESALPLPASQTEQRAREARLAQWLKEEQVPLLTGALRRSTTDEQREVATNSAQHFDTTGIVATYDKNRLVPLAERVPFEEAWQGMQFLRVDAGGVPAYHPGTKQVLFTVKDQHLGPLICFESLFSNYTRRLVGQGAHGLVVFSQVDWWRTSLAARHYLAFSRLRAIENRRSMLISTVAGYSAVILPSGVIDWQSNWHEQGAHVVHFPLYETQTLFTRWGPLLYPAALILWMGILLHILVQTLKARPA